MTPILTDEQILEAARANGCDEDQRFRGEITFSGHDQLTAFARAVADAAIEKCAEVIDAQDVDPAFKRRLSQSLRAMKGQGCG